MTTKTSLYYLLLLLLTISVACNNGDTREAKLDYDGKSGRKGEKEFQYSREEARAHLDKWIDSATVSTNLPKIREKQFAEELFAFYSKRDFMPAWTQATATDMLNLVENISQEGLNPESYPLDTLRDLLATATRQEDARTGARLDMLLSATYLNLADVIATGKVKQGDLAKSWHIKPVAPDTLFTHLEQGLASGNIDASLDYFRPRYDQYEKLQRHIDTYSKIIENGGLPTVEKGDPLAPGYSSKRMESIRKRLYATRDLQTPPEQWTKPHVYDSSLVAAVNRYQLRNGLEIQPSITDEMIEAMNVPAEQRLKQIMLNMDRIRWFSASDMEDTYVLVNIPEYRLRVFEDGQPIKTMNVVVGKQMNSTPIFSDKIQYAVFSPYWNIPTSIAREEIWPKAKRNPGYLSSRHYEVLDGWGKDAQVIPPSQIDWDNLSEYRIRQKPGPWNSLGRVKFMFPNDYAIYLHDTPADHLFEEYERAFSHGCIRVEEPAWFAYWLFPQYSRQDVQRKMNNTNRDVVSLEEEIPVYIFYLTSFVDEEGRINFRKDLYEFDKRLTPTFDII